MNPRRQTLNLNTKTPEKIKGSGDIIFTAPFQFKDHDTFPLQQDIGLEDIELYIIFFDQLINERPVASLLRKA